MATPNPDKLKKVKDIGRQDILFGVARVPGTERLFVGSSDFKVHELDLAAKDKPAIRELAGHESYVTCVALTAGGVVSGSYDGKLIWWDTEKGTQTRAVDAHRKYVRGLAVSPDGKTVVSVADDMIARVWDAATGKMLHELRGHKELTPANFGSMLYAAAISPDGKFVATGDKVGHVIVWDLATGKQVAELDAPVMYTWDATQRLHSIGGIRSLAFSPDGESLAVGGTGKIGNIDHLEAKGRVEVFLWRKGERTIEYVDDKSQGLVNHLEYHPSGDWLLAAGGAGDGFLVFIDPKTKKALRQEKAPMHVHDVVFDEKHEVLYVVGHQKLCVYELRG